MGRGSAHGTTMEAGEHAARPRGHAALLRWYDTHKRDLPWRGVHDPYAVWVSEVMLQQTRVDTVIPYFTRWMARFPTIAALADAAEDDVMSTWQGLGYYRRARSLHGGARFVVERHDGELPMQLSALLEVPGIGPYTAGAIASIAFGSPVPAVDGNVLRVVARHEGIEDDVLGTRGRRAVTTVAERWVDERRPGDWNQALMELGARVCSPTNPACDACPLADDCVAYSTGRCDELPVRSKNKRPPSVEMHVLVLRDDGGSVWVERRPDDGLLAGLWGLPTTEDLANLLSGIGVDRDELVERGEVDHVFTHRRWRMRVHEARARDRNMPDADGRFVPMDRLGDLGIATAHRKVLALIDAASDPRGVDG